MTKIQLEWGDGRVDVIELDDTPLTPEEEEDSLGHMVDALERMGEDSAAFLEEWEKWGEEEDE